MARVPKSATVVKCPRCDEKFYTSYDANVPATENAPYPAVSRFDNVTYICSDCGSAEAMDDLIGAKLSGPDEWPVCPMCGQSKHGEPEKI